MGKKEPQILITMQMELSDMIEKLLALHEYITEFLESERKTNGQTRSRISNKDRNRH